MIYSSIRSSIPAAIQLPPHFPRFPLMHKDGNHFRPHISFPLDIKNLELSPAEHHPVDMGLNNFYRLIAHGRNFDNSRMSWSKFSKSDLRNCSFKHSTTLKLFVYQCDMRSTDFSYANLTGMFIKWSYFDGSSFMDSFLKLSSFGDSSLVNVVMSGSDLAFSKISNCDLTGADLSYTEMYGGKYNNTCFEQANFSHANAEAAIFKKSRLKDANFNYANLKNADFTGADLSNANLSHANLTGARFHGAKLTGVNVDGAKLDNIMPDSVYLQIIAAE